MNGIDSSQSLPIKVPVVITFFFWLIKILATTVGETGADYLSFSLHFGLPLTSLLMLFVLALFLYAQVNARKYIPWLYWISVVLVSIVGTLITDNLTDNLDVPLMFSTIAFAIALLVTFLAWYRQEGSLSIHSISNLRRELFYWAAILFTFALGTAAGDLMAESTGLGYARSALFFAGTITLVSTAYYVFKLNSVLAFWLAYILTRPLGASIGDYLSQPLTDGGLGLGTVATSALFLVLILVLVSYLSISRIDTPPGQPEPARIRHGA